MAFTLEMPEVGETVTEGTIEKWLKQPGDPIEKYEPIVEINTDKVNVELPSPVTGTVIEHLVQAGDTVPIGTPLCTIDVVGDEAPAEITPLQPADAGASKPSRNAPAEAVASQTANGQGAPGRATPRVRKVASELGVNLAQVEGTGPRGRVVERDVRAFAEIGGKAGAAPQSVSVSSPPSEAVSVAGDEAIAVTGVRRTIAQRMTQSAFTAPHAWLVVEVDVTGLVELRTARKEAFRARHAVDLTYLPFAAHAVVQALTDHPYLNAMWADDKIILKKNVNLGVAVATERGLIVPVVQGADRLSVAGLALAMSELGEKARTNRLQLRDVQDGTFTLDNTGAFGSVVSMPIINQGQAAIISLEAIARRPVVVAGDAIAIRSMVNICLSFDHRILDGHQAGAFLQDVKKRLELFGPDTGID